MKRASLLPRSRKDHVVIRELDDETLVYDMDRDEAHCLNRTAALVWAQCDGKTTAAQAARALAGKLDASVDTDLVWLAVKQLQRFDLVEATAKAPRVSRRDLVLKYAPIAIVLLPVIVSITAPTPAQAATCGQFCGSGGGCPLGCRCSFSTGLCVPSGGA
jgi:hypothetical protein